MTVDPPQKVLSISVARLQHACFSPVDVNLSTKSTTRCCQHRPSIQGMFSTSEIFAESIFSSLLYDKHVSLFYEHGPYRIGMKSNSQSLLYHFVLSNSEL